jgi:hypothetical protein
MKFNEYVKSVLNEGKRNPKAQKYYEIVFMQGEEAEEPLKILEDKGESAAIEYLKDWDYGKENEHPGGRMTITSMKTTMYFPTIPNWDILALYARSKTKMKM